VANGYSVKEGLLSELPLQSGGGGGGALKIIIFI